ncbi:Gfo/Idh/MocA family protein [Streptomyces sp. NBC_01314]|uniref:Gfo/Idh/MocA family protein n=1 Tax=Streptomyces sp. NBC_01314 TaxID=2903821 RepID=UPI00308D584E|nr:Gfo/Idh/MocA family oxidoreductase [Streptomyces sp. NBC_01314]
MVNLRAAVVGCGRIASTDHASAHAADPRVNLAAVVDPDYDRARSLARRFGVREVFTSLEEMLATTDVDLVSVCAAPHPHAPLATTALRAGCHVLCEPPAATDAADLARLAAIATAEHRVLTVAFPYRHLTETRTARGIVDAGEIGEIHDIQLTVRGCHETPAGGRHHDRAVGGDGPRDRPRGADEPRRSRAADEPCGGFRADGDPCDGFRADGDPGGGFRGAEGAFDRPLATADPHDPHRARGACGPLTDTGIHLLDLAMWITGFPEVVETLCAPHGLVIAKGTSQVRDRATTLVRCRDGMSLSITTSYAARPADEETVRVRLLGDRGGLEVFPLLLSHPDLPAPGHSRLPLPGKPWDLRLARRRQIAAFVDACLGRGPAPVTAAEAIHVQEIVDRLQRSAHDTAVRGESDARGQGEGCQQSFVLGQLDIRGQLDVRGQSDLSETVPTTVDDLVQEASRA